MSADECTTNLAIALETCKSLGVPVASHKVEFPRTSKTFLGIELDTQQGILRLPEDKLARLRVMLQGWTDMRTCTKRELRSLIGMLQHVASVVKPGRIFLRRLIDLSTVPKRLHHLVRLNREARSDIGWWARFAVGWNG